MKILKECEIPNKTKELIESLRLNSGEIKMYEFDNEEFLHYLATVEVDDNDN